MANALVKPYGLAMYAGKIYVCDTVAGGIEVFDEEMRASAVARLELETDLKHATEQNQLVNWYQAIVSLTDGRICGFEALLRWRLGVAPVGGVKDALRGN